MALSEAEVEKQVSCDGGKAGLFCNSQLAVSTLPVLPQDSTCPWHLGCTNLFFSLSNLHAR